jgi:hypothetical protein
MTGHGNRRIIAFHMPGDIPDLQSRARSGNAV